MKKESSKITANLIELAIVKYYNARANLIIPNVHDGFAIHECDLLIVNRNHYCTEVEIKVSVADFKADFKKRHHHVDKKHRIKYFYYAVPHYIVDKIIDDLPENAGLIVVHEKRRENTCSKPQFFTVVKKRAVAVKNCRTITANELMTLQRLALLRLWSYKKEIQELKDRYKYETLLV